MEFSGFRKESEILKMTLISMDSHGNVNMSPPNKEHTRTFKFINFLRLVEQFTLILYFCFRFFFYHFLFVVL